MKTYIGNQCSVELLPFSKSTQTMVEEQVALANREGKDESFIICDLGDIIQKYQKWVQQLPRVKPFYAVKCNDDYGVLKILADCGASFDCASKHEIQKVLSLGVTPDRIIYANPCKQSSMIKYAAKKEVAMMTFDNEPELHKIKALYPDAKLVLRILPPSNFAVQCELGIKFGCNPSKARPLLQAAQNLGLNVMGISFHVGSGCKEAEAFAAAIQQARMVFNTALEMGFHMTLLDIGGGYPGQENAAISFHQIVNVVTMALDKYFPAEEGVEIIAEPGRFMVASAFTLGVNIIAKRVVARDQHGENGELVDSPTKSDEPAFMYYVNDGVYGSFNCLLFDHQTVVANTLKENEDEMMYESSVWGPTCDGIDCILKSVPLPMHEVGEWLYFQDMGAYTVAAASTFNGMQPPTKSYYCLEDIWYQVDSHHGNYQKESACIPIDMLPSMKAGHSVFETTTFEDILQPQFSEGLALGQM